MRSNRESRHHQDHPLMVSTPGEAPVTSGIGNDTPSSIKQRKRGRRKSRSQKSHSNIHHFNRLPLPEDAIGTNIERLAKKFDQLTPGSKKLQEYMSWVGDEMTYDDSWPHHSQRQYIRLFGLNMNGISYHNEYIEWDMTLQLMQDMQVDLFSLTEPNLDLNVGAIRERLRTTVRRQDPHACLITSASKQTLDITPFKMGGTITHCHGGWSGRIKRSGDDPLGRWTFLALEAAKGREVVIFTIYRVCAQTSSVGAGTIYMQQKKDILDATGNDLDPRQHILDSLSSTIQEEHSLGNIVILLGDVNEDLTNKDNNINQFLINNGLCNAFEVRFGDNGVSLPTTYDRGSTCIDLMAITAGLPPKLIHRCGYLPFYFNYATDHRGYFLDLDIGLLFDYVATDTVRPIFRRFTTSRISANDRYIKALEECLERSRMFDCVADLEAKMFQHLKTNGNNDLPATLVRRCQLLCEKTSELMRCAEKKAGPAPYKGGHRFSVRLREAAYNVTRIKKLIRLRALDMLQDENLGNADLQYMLASAQQELRTAQQSSHQLREEHLNELAEKRANQWNLRHSEALHIIKEAERSKDQHARHRRLLKNDTKGTLRQVLVPLPITGKKNNLKDKSQYMSVSNPRYMEDILLRRNFRALLLSNHSIFRRGRMLDLTGWDAEGDATEAILQGTLNAEEVASHYPEFKRECVAFIKALRQPEPVKATPFVWTYGEEEFCATFRRTRESTACGPSGLHMSHWKAAAERPRIARVHAFFIWAAFQFGFSYRRWEQSWHCMLQKLSDPFVSKLRIIQLFEGDFNGGLKFLMGRLLMQYMTENALLDKETFGSRLGKTAPEAMINLQLLFDHHRLWLLVLIIIFNDAAGCYDRIPPNLSDLTLRRTGAPKNLARAHTIVQRMMKHFVRIAAGVSLGFLQFATIQQLSFQRNSSHVKSLRGLIGGIGQGGGGGPLIWLTVTIVMIEAFRGLCEGAEMQDPLGWHSFFMWLVSYVDDNTLVRSFPADTTSECIFEGIKDNISTWRNLLQVTGGDLSIEKSSYSVMKWDRHVSGKPILMTSTTLPGEVRVSSAIDPLSVDDILPRQEPWQAERVLGIRLPMTGSFTTEFKFRVQQIKKFATKMYSMPLSHHDAWVIYESRYRAMVRYPLPVTLFTSSQAHKIQQPFMQLLLPKLGLNRHMARAIIYGPKQYGGLQLMDLRIEQPTILWETTLGHIRRMDRVGLGLRVTLNDHQVLVGSTTFFLHLDPTVYNYTDANTRWKYIWKFLHSSHLYADIFDTWTPQLSSPSDANLMDVATSDWYFKGYHNWQLRLVNACRTYLRVFNFSDLTADGDTILPGFIDGSVRQTHPDIHFPARPNPTAHEWKVWRDFLMRNFIGAGRRVAVQGTLPSSDYAAPIHIRDETELAHILRLRGWKTSLSVMCAHFPPALVALLGEVRPPRDNGEYLLQLIQGGLCIGACDGSLVTTFHHKRGGHSFGLSSKLGDDDRDWFGFSPTPTTYSMTSTTTEHYGVLCLITILHALVAVHGHDHFHHAPTLTIYLDNKEAIERANDTPAVLNISDFLRPDRDLWQLTNILKDALPFPVLFTWVKGHQDELDDGTTIYGPFLRSVQMNIRADAHATKGRQQGMNSATSRILLSTSGMQLRHRESGDTIDCLRQYLLLASNGKALLDYCKGKWGWHHFHLQRIDWEALSQLLSSTRPLQRIRLSQMMFGWQHVGRQKSDYASSTGQSSEDQDLGKCPCGCGEMEEQLHFLSCPSEPMVTLRRTEERKLVRHLQKLQTYPGIIFAISCVLRAFEQDNDPDIPVSDFDGPHGHHLGTALNDQDFIGWDNMMRGFISKHWGISQERYTQAMTLPSPGTNKKRRWTAHLVRTLQEFTLNCWYGRNKILHGESKRESRLKLKAKLRDKVQQLYTRFQDLGNPPGNPYFRLPLHQRLKHGTHSLQLWTDMAESSLGKHLHREATIQTRIDRWLRCRQGESHNP